MKKSTMLGVIDMALAMGVDGMGHEPYNQSQPKKPILPPKKFTPFNEQVKHIIDEYKSIKAGTCTKGKMKQIRTANKIEAWVTQGYLTLEDIT